MESGTFTIDSEYSSVTGFISRMRDENFYGDISDRVRGEIEICLVEALNNVVKHSYSEESGHNIVIKLNNSDGWVSITINEDGSPRPEMDAPNLDFDPDDIDNIPEGGMGLFIIDQLMDETNYTSENGQNTFVMKKKLN